jgi:hypothetical protein
MLLLPVKRAPASFAQKAISNQPFQGHLPRARKHNLRRRNAVKLQELCTGLEQFGVPSAIANLNEQRFVAWNAIFLEQTGFSEAEISMLNVGSTVVLSDSTILGPGGTEKYSPGLIPCVVRAALGLSVLWIVFRSHPAGGT